MAYTLRPWQVFLAAIDFLREENRILLEQLGDRRIRLTDEKRRRLAVAGKAVGRRALPGGITGRGVDQVGRVS